MRTPILFWEGRREYNPKEPADSGRAAKTYLPQAFGRHSESEQLLCLGYHAPLVHRHTGSRRCDEFEEFLAKCQRVSGSEFFYGAVRRCGSPITDQVASSDACVVSAGNTPA